MSSPSMTPANQLLLTDSQSNIRFDGFSAPDLSHCSNFSIFSDIDSFFGPELNFEDLGPENQSVGGMQDSASANLENHANGDIESSTATVQSLEEWILSLRKKLKGYFFPANQKLTEERMDEISSDLSQIEKAETIPPNVIRNTKIRRLFRTIMTLEMIPRDNELQIKKRVSGLLKSWGEPAILSNTKAQSKSTRQQIVVDLTGETAGDHEFATPPDTPKSMLLSSSSIDFDPPISSETSSRPASDGNPNPRKRKHSTGSDTSRKRRQPPRKTPQITTVKQHLANEIRHSSQWLVGIEKSIDDYEADLVTIEKRKARFLAEIEEKREEVTCRRNEFIELKRSMVAWGACDEGVSEEWKSR